MLSPQSTINQLKNKSTKYSGIILSMPYFRPAPRRKMLALSLKLINHFSGGVGDMFFLVYYILAKHAVQ